MSDHKPVHNDALNAPGESRLGRAVRWGLVLGSAFVIAALVAGVVTVRAQTGRLASPERTMMLAAHTEALQVELADFDQNMDTVFHGLMEARGISSRARNLVGLRHAVATANPAAVAAANLAAAAAEAPRTSDTPLGRALVASRASVTENLREAQRLKGSFREIVTGMNSQAEVWARIPSTPPIADARLTSDFGLRRDPFTRRVTWHRGLDLAAPHGTPVRASAEGKVTRAGRYSGYGMLVEIDHLNGIRTRYAHNSRLAVRTGDMVRRGSVIAFVGSTGRATSAHLHYEVLLNGEAVNPEPYLLPETFFAD